MVLAGSHGCRDEEEVLENVTVYGMVSRHVEVSERALLLNRSML